MEPHKPHLDTLQLILRVWFSCLTICNRQNCNLTCIASFAIVKLNYAFKTRPTVYMYMYTYTCRSIYRWGGQHIHLNVKIHNEYLYNIYTQHIHFFNMHQTCHITYMKYAYHLPITPSTCTVHATLLIRTLHAF